MATYYSTPEDVIRRTGVQPSDLGIEDADVLDEFLVGLLTEIADLIDRKIQTSYLDATVPAGLTGIASDIAADSIRIMVATRQTPVTRIDDFAVQVIRTQMLSTDVVKRLRLYGTSGGFRAVSLSNLE